jgi:hypothetical protein
MERSKHFTQSGVIPFPLLEAEGTWDPSVFLGEWVGVLGALPNGPGLGEVATVFEGERFLYENQGVPYLRASSVLAFELFPEGVESSISYDCNEGSVRPGDVIVKRVAPVSAAVVVGGSPSLRVDGNLFVIRGLSEAGAWWIAFCLNYPSCADYLISKSGRGVLGRISLSILREWHPPQTPLAFSGLSRRLAELLSKRVFLSGQFAGLESEVEAEVAERLNSDTSGQLEEDLVSVSWSSFFPAAALDESWLPVHVAGKHRSNSRRKGGEWKSIRRFLIPATPSRQRFLGIEEPIRMLRLGDISNIPVVPDSLPDQVPPQANRVFATPLVADDVLLSTLGSRPRVVFTPAPLEQPVFPVDHWERLRFHSHAGAYVLILRTEPILEQLRTLATGTVQQFVRPDDIQQLQLPVLPDDTLARWDRTFRSLTRAWSQTSSEWSSTLNDGWQIFTRALSESSPAPTHR